ncbi:hypothetical protein PAAG_02286 [Paracoccidioides lutzii Pb01]|uniref:Uncharacterized protein n=1 Tax=Paracoccidioides lutzii (strain ATCC MYA-826 / Pb01) TaxID=502779 RepID=C1GVK9_PARBA|nr:hypothetical protein PAAG_02286 [Paracoccidioides lutzii Pb01]EEH40231.2 hypothetical protein PAAG_02286 [Paracoccidioides lutzii Pb01]
MELTEEPTVSLQWAHYKVRWVCALPLEKAVAIASLDERHDPPYDLSGNISGDRNSYSFGRVGRHNIVITVLPAGKYGTNSAASVTTNLSNISKPGPGHPGVMQYDFGKIGPNKVTLMAVLNQPPTKVLTAISTMEAYEMVGEGGISDLVNEIVEKNLGRFTNPGTNHDFLYQAEYPHVGGDSCDACDRSMAKTRTPRTNAEPVIHYGLIASGNSVIKDAKTRDRLAKAHGILCYEMEAAGIMHILRCLVIRGICDYSESHKNKRWQGYAAATAAVYAKSLLLSMGSTIYRRTTAAASTPPPSASPTTLTYSPGPIFPSSPPSSRTRSIQSPRPRPLSTPPTSPALNPLFGKSETRYTWQRQPRRRLNTLNRQVDDAEEVLDAAKSGNISRVREFVENGGDPNTSDTAFNTTLLHYMAQQGNEDMTRFLLESGANPNAAAKFSTNTPLIEAARNGYPDVVQRLLRHGADIETCGEFKRTTLHIAADEGQFACVTVLVDSGADPQVSDENGDTPLVLAEEGNWNKVASYLRQL